MPYKLTWELSGVYRQYFGDVSIAQRRASFDEICGDHRFDNLRYAITDYLAVERYEITEGATAEMAALHIGPLSTNPRIAIAAVTTRPDIIAAINDLKGYGFTSAPYEIFDTVEAARQWIRSATR